MKKLFLLCVLSVVYCVNAYSQDLEAAQKAAEAEQFEKAKDILKNLIKTDPTKGEYYLQLGNLHVMTYEDSLANVCFNEGLKQKEDGNLNYIGLGLLNLNGDKHAEAAADFAKAMQNVKKKDTRGWVYIANAYLKASYPDYQQAVDYAQKALTINPKLASAYLALGDAQYMLSRNEDMRDKINDAFSAYRNAYEYDNSMLRAKLQLAVITKNARSFPEAEQALNEILAINPNYGPAYRELAETYGLWSQSSKENHTEYLNKALSYYRKYIDLTDYSLSSRMRHADFLILSKSYGTLEKEAQEMQKMDKANPRIYRYLGFAAFENGNYKNAISAINTFIAKVDPKRVIGLDYSYLARAEMRLAVSPEGVVLDPESLTNALAHLKQCFDMKTDYGAEFNDAAFALFKARDYVNAAKIFGVLSEAPKPNLMHGVYYANSIFYNAVSMTDSARVSYQSELHKADTAYGLVIAGSPTSADPYFFRARLNRYFTDASESVRDANVVKFFEQYIQVLSEKSEVEKSKAVRKLSEAYTTIGSYYAETNKEKAIENFEKALAIEPTNEHAQKSLEFLKKK